MTRTAIDPTGHDSAATFDREHVFHRHHEGLVDGALRLGNVVIHHIQQLFDAGVFGGILVGRGAFQRLQGAAAHDGGLVAGEFVLGQHFAQFQLNQLQQFGVVHLVGFVEEHHDRGHFHLARQQYVLARLGHGTIGSCHHQDGAIHLRRTGDHVLDVVAMSRHVHMGVVAVLGRVLDVRNVDGNTARFFFRRVIDGVIAAEIRGAQE